MTASWWRRVTATAVTVPCALVGSAHGLRDVELRSEETEDKDGNVFFVQVRGHRESVDRPWGSPAPRLGVPAVGRVLVARVWAGEGLGTGGRGALASGPPVWGSVTWLSWAFFTHRPWLLSCRLNFHDARRGMTLEDYGK